jgi:hypothetical protein
MQQLAPRLGLSEALEPDAQGIYQIVFDDALVVRCFQSGKELFICGSVGKLSDNPRQVEEKLQHVLRYSLARIKEKAEILTLEDDQEMILYRRIATEGLQVETLHRILGAYVNSLAYWNKKFVDEPSRSGSALPFLFP